VSSINGLTPVDQAFKPGWKKASRAMYLTRSFDYIDGIMGEMEFRDVHNQTCVSRP
jgi:hypothetical protein